MNSRIRIALLEDASPLGLFYVLFKINECFIDHRLSSPSKIFANEICQYICHNIEEESNKYNVYQFHYLCEEIVPVANG